MNQKPDISFDYIFNEYQKPILKYLTYMVSTEEAEGLCQEVFEKVSRNLEKFKGRSAISTWVYRIATNTALDHFRKQKKQPKKTEVDPELTENKLVDFPIINPSVNTPLHDIISSEMNDCIREQIDKLPEKYRTVMILASLKELSQNEIGQILDISINNVKTRLHRGRSKLKEILENQCRFYNHPETGNLCCDRKQSPKKM